VLIVAAKLLTFTALAFRVPGDGLNMEDRLYVGGEWGSLGQPNIANLVRTGEPQSESFIGYRGADGWKTRP
jgi:hypothetical protein